jgi:hypothetical protein
MTRRSPSPKTTSRTWLWFVVAIASWAVVCVVAIAMAPTWAESWVRDKLVDKLSTRLEQPVEIGEIELDYEHAVLRELVIGDPEAPIVRLDEVVVDLEGHVLWRARVDVARVHVEGGRVQGDRATLEGLARKALRPRRAEPPASDRRIRVMPKSLELSDVWVVVDEPDDPRVSHVEARVRAEIDPKALTASVALHDVRVQPRRGPIVTAGKVASTLVVERGPDGPQLV